MDWFLYDNGLRLERVNEKHSIFLGGNFPDTEEKIKKIKLQMNEQEILLQ